MMNSLFIYLYLAFNTRNENSAHVTHARALL
jgi:hypothetical protein